MSCFAQAWCPNRWRPQTAACEACEQPQGRPCWARAPEDVDWQRHAHVALAIGVVQHASVANAAVRSRDWVKQQGLVFLLQNLRVWTGALVTTLQVATH